MPKLIIVTSELKKKDRKAQTSLQNVKKLVEKRVEKDPADTVYTLVTLNTKMKLANVVQIINSSVKGLMEHEGMVSVEKLTVAPDKVRGKWELETLAGGKPAKKAKEAPAAAAETAPKKKKKKKKA